MRAVRTRSAAWAAALLAVAALLLPAAATAAARQESATPTPAAGVIESESRVEARARIDAVLGYTEAAEEGGTFVDSTVTDIQTVNPLLADEDVTISLTGLIFEGLTGIDPVTGQPAPIALADRWRIAPDRVTYTFDLNRDARWHDGVDLTADDVVFSFDALADPALGSAYTGSFAVAVASYRAVDADTVEVVAREPLATFLYDISGLVVVPRHLWEGVPREAWAADPGSTGQDPARVVGTGPFTFVEWRQGDSVALARNDDYYGQVPHLERYLLRIWPDQTQAVNALLNGEIDATGLEPADVAAVEGVEGITVASYPSRAFSFYELNLDPAVTPLFQDVRVRQALLLAVDRQAIVDEIMLGYGVVAEGTQPPISYAYAPDRNSTRYPYDPERARQLLAEAGWTDSDGDGTVDKEGQAFAFELLHESGSPTTAQVVAYLQDAWAAVGVAATPRALEFAALIEAVTNPPTFEAALLAFAWDASFLQDAMFGCDQYEVGFNFMRYCNPRLDEINRQARREFDPERRAELLIEASNLINDDVPVGILFFRESIVAFSDRLQNYRPGPWGVELAYVWMAA